MKKIVYLLLFFAWSTLQAQNFSVVSTERLSLDDTCLELKFDNSGKQLLLSLLKSGVLVYDLKEKGIKKVDVEGVNVRYAVFSEDDSMIYFTKSLRENRLLYKELYAFDLKSNSERILEKKSRNLAVPKLSNKNNLVYTGEGRLKKVKARSSRRIVGHADEFYVCIENQHLVLYTNEKRQVLDPCGEGSYIWPSLSPEGDKILFTEVRGGTYIFDLKNKELDHIGKIDAPAWVNKDWIVGMETKDDGEQFTQGAIFVIDTQGKNKQYISSINEISLYPTVARDGQKIAYVTEEGSAYIVSYELK